MEEIMAKELFKVLSVSIFYKKKQNNMPRK